MAQPLPEERTTLNNVLKLVDKLTPEEREKLLQQLKLDDLRHKVQIGIDQADRGELIDGEELLDELRQRAEDRLRKSQQ